MYEILLTTFITLAVVLWIWAVIDIVKQGFFKDINALPWLLVIFFLPVIGPILYFQFKGRMPNKRRTFNPDFGHRGR